MPKIPLDCENRISPAFQKRFEELSEELDIPKSELAARFKVSPSVITRAKIYGIVPSLKILIRIADELQVALPYLLGETDDRAFYPSDKNVTFHERLKSLTAERHTTYAKIAHHMPFSKNFFYEWQRMKILPSLDYLRALAEFFDVSIDYLLGRTDDRK